MHYSGYHSRENCPREKHPAWALSVEQKLEGRREHGSQLWSPEGRGVLGEAKATRNSPVRQF